MKILVMNPPFLKKYARSMRCPAVTKSGTLIYPYWIMYATGVLEKAGFEVKLIDAPAESLNLDDILKKLVSFKPDLIVTDTSTASIYNDCQIAETLKKVYPHSFVILVGPHVSVLPEETLRLNKNIDAVARKEYDYTLRDLAFRLKDKGDLRSVLGISFREGDNIIHNPDRPFIENLDELPFISKACKKHLNIKNYFYSADLYPLITILGSRGCPYHCTYCLFPQTFMGHHYRVRSVDNIIEEIKYIVKTFPQIKEIKFEDDTTINDNRCIELCDKIIQNKLKIVWTINSRADVDYKVLKKMHGAGCRLLCVGIESGTQEILDNLKKQIKVDRIRQFMEDAKKAGILVHGCFLVGCPGETKETLENTLDFAIELEPDTAQFFSISFYPGTTAYQWAKENNFFITDDFSKWLTPDGMLSCIVSRPGLSNVELVDFCDYARRRFYLRPKYMIRKLKQCLLHSFEALRTLKSLKTFGRHIFRRAYK